MVTKNLILREDKFFVQGKVLRPNGFQGIERKPATKNMDKTKEQIMSEPRHNMAAYLHPEGKVTEFKEITRWLCESRINEAITHQTPVYKTLVKELWDSANVIEVDGKEIIRGQVKERDVDVSADIHNTVLQLNDNQEAPYSVPIMCQRGCLLRMKCTDDIFGGQINKITLPMRYKFLLHILIQCLSNRRSGYDTASNDVIGLMVALVLNKPFNISNYLFSNMKENLRRTGASGHKFWMYPRFLQMIMNVQHPDLPKEANDVLKIEVMIEHSLKIFKGVAAKCYPEETPRKLFGALGDKNYVAPANDKWRHDKLDIFGDTDSEDDGDGGDDKGGEGGDGGNVGASAASARGGDNDNSDSDDNPPEPGYEHYIDERGIRQLHRIRIDQDQDEDYVPSDTEAELRKKKQIAIRRKKKMKKTIGTSSSEPATVQQETVAEPVREADVNPQFVFTAEETTEMMTSPSAASQPPPTTTSAPETPVVTPPTEPQHLGTSSSQQQRSEAHQRSSERRGRMFSQMGSEEKVNFLFSQLQAAAEHINWHSEFMSANKNTMLR
ncbi:hypothetical protein HanHA300_Chr02g0070851 [Helianthus annuus]|nr:hypothetical protein HanHA300_Chr02g0070851 [Helianthus annuus]KAJ0787578.1 hypothetical protein HanOQP8_Chr02g0083981 [Helianthus annuus]